MILYIAGTPRSGSTLLGRLLGETPGVFCAGEVAQYWRAMCSDEEVCGCGLPPRTCPVWSEVASESGVSREQACRLARMVPRLWQLRRLVAMAASRRTPAEFLELARQSEAVYAALTRTLGCRVIVDTSKIPAYAYLLTSSVGLDLRIVQLVRDPRGVAYSGITTKPRPGLRPGRYMDFKSLRSSVASWLTWNLATEVMWRRSRDSGHYALVRYEDFVERPHDVARRILAMVGVEYAEPSKA